MEKVTRTTQKGKPATSCYGEAYENNSKGKMRNELLRGRLREQLKRKKTQRVVMEKVTRTTQKEKP